MFVLLNHMLNFFNKKSCRCVLALYFGVLSIFLNLPVSEAAPVSRTKPPTAEEYKIVAQAKLGLFVKQFNAQVQTGKDMERVFFHHLKGTEKNEMRAYFKKLGKAPKLTLTGSLLTFDFGKKQLRVRWPDLERNQILFESVSWTYDATAPLLWQIKNFENKIKTEVKKSEDTAFFSWVLPEAHAVLPAAIAAACMASSACTWISITAAGAIVGGFAGDAKRLAGDGSCYLISEAGFKPWTSVGWCQDWKTRMDNFSQKQAAENAAAEDKVGSTTNWVPSGAQCGVDENNENYATWMAELNKDADGKWKQKGNWFMIKAKKTDGKMVEINSFRSKEDSADPNAALAQFIYTTKSGKAELERLRLRSKDQSSDTVSETGFVTVLTVDKEADIPVEYREEATKMKALAKAVEEWFEFCSNQNFANEYRREAQEDAAKAKAAEATK